MKPMHLKKKQYNITLIILSVVLALSCAIGGVTAWLISKPSGPVVNTFVGSNLEISLAETATNFKMVPGQLIAKDPMVTVNANSVKCYLFMKVEETSSPDLDAYMTYSINSGWTKYGSSSDPVTYYYRVVDTSTSNQTFQILTGHSLSGYEDGYVMIPDTVSKELLTSISDGDVKLTFSLCAVQYAAMTNVDAAFAQTGW